MKSYFRRKKEIIFGQDPSRNVSTGHPDWGNTASDVDIKRVSLAKFIDACTSGDLYTLDALLNSGNDGLWVKIKDNIEELLYVNERAIKAIKHRAQQDLISIEDYKQGSPQVTKAMKSAAHSYRLLQIASSIIRTGKFEYSDSFSADIRCIKECRLSPEGVNNLLNRCSEDIAYAKRHKPYRTAEEQKKIVAKWNHWVYCIYLEIVRRERK